MSVNFIQLRLIACRLAKISTILIFCTALFALLWDQFVGFWVRNEIYDQIEQTPYRPYALVLGTSKYVAKNKQNLFYQHRLASAKALFDAQKVDYLLLSGDNRSFRYNEPQSMRKDLMKMGIEEKFLFLDYAGFRTLDSIIRAKEVFQAEPMLIISQRFHCERALFIAQYHGINAICFAADNPHPYSLTRLREIPARTLMLWELFTKKAPHFLGKSEPLPR